MKYGTHRGSTRSSVQKHVSLSEAGYCKLGLCPGPGNGYGASVPGTPKDPACVRCVVAQTSILATANESARSVLHLRTVHSILSDNFRVPTPVDIPSPFQDAFSYPFFVRHPMSCAFLIDTLPL